MARVARKESSSSIYHVMIRGINKQVILEDDEDNKKFLEVLKVCKELSGYRIYAYCLMGNHIHLLLKVEKEGLEQIFKRLGARYVYYFNQKYKRSGHLFQDRFKSEPVENEDYLITVLRYIHNNPVKAGMSVSVDQYQWNSYNQYIHFASLVDTELVLGMMGIDEFIYLHHQADNETVLDIKEDNFRMTDAEAKMIVKKVCGTESSNDFLYLDIQDRNRFIKELKGKGLSIRQLARITGVSKGIIEKI
ncbi:transposase [Lucifera butyrica]|nr:transposase [Lucifera butyrica]